MPRFLHHWPPVLWLAVYVGSVLVLMGSQRREMLVVGACLIVLAWGLAVWLAVRPEPGRPRPKVVDWMLGGVAAFYVIAAIAAAPLGPDDVVASLSAGLVPMTAVAITMATARRKTRVVDGRVQDLSEEDMSPFPGVGFDDETPLGDTPEHGAEDEDPVAARRRRLQSARGQRGARR
jgi:hypothetical protein